MKKLFKIPELSILIILSIAVYLIIGFFSKIDSTEVLSSTSIVMIVICSFILSTAIAVLAVVVGVGGGVLFTPMLLAFTAVDTLIIRSTGLVVAMFSGLVSSGPFLRKGLADIKIVFYCSVPIIIGGLCGAVAAIYLSSILGETGDAIVRLSLGLLLVFIAILFIMGGSKNEYPKPKKSDPVSIKLGLSSAYFEESLQKIIKYQAVNVITGLLLFFAVGFTGGFFGLGGGWAVVPVLNLVMMVPLKVSAACSGVLLAMGNAAAIWPYIRFGALLAIFAFPWMLGQVIGGILGACILAKIKAGVVRKILIFILFLTSFKLISRGLEVLLKFDIPVL
ncbi:MAG: sulfite exporter TauE/SafE family protein [bacterium]